MNITGKCAHCGAQVVFGDDITVIKCDYCDSINVVQDCIPVSTIAPLSDQAASAVLREIIPDLKYAANFQKFAGNTQGGHVWINKEDLFFKPHKFNFGGLDKVYVHIPNIIGYTIEHDVVAKNLTFYTDKGSMTVLVWPKAARTIVTEVETRRKAYYKERGMQAPQLTKLDNDCRTLVNNTGDTVQTVTTCVEGEIGKPENKWVRWGLIAFVIIVLLKMCS